MCDRYPNCQHKGKVMKKISGLPRHCETSTVNSNCPYLQLGCNGCTFKQRLHSLKNIASYMRLR